MMALISAGRYRTWRSAGLVGLLVLLLVFAAADLAVAKPKKTGLSNGCTMEQIQAPSANQCMKQLDQDVMDGVAYPHQLFCDETGVYCCQSDGSRTFGCKKVSQASIKPGTLTIQPGLLQGGTLQKAPQ